MKTLQEIALKGCGEYVSKCVQNWDMQDLMALYIKSFQEGKISYSRFVQDFQLLKDDDKKQQEDFIKYLHFKEMVNIPSHWCTWCHQIVLDFHVETDIWEAFVRQLDDLSLTQKREMIVMNKMKVSQNLIIMNDSFSIFNFFECYYIELLYIVSIKFNYVVNFYDFLFFFISFSFFISWFFSGRPRSQLETLFSSASVVKISLIEPHPHE